MWKSTLKLLRILDINSLLVVLLILPEINFATGKQQMLCVEKKKTQSFQPSYTEFSSSSAIRCGGLCLANLGNQCYRFAFSPNTGICRIVSINDIGDTTEMLSSDFDVFGGEDECALFEDEVCGDTPCTIALSCHCSEYVSGTESDITSAIREHLQMNMSSEYSQPGYDYGPEKAVDGIYTPPGTYFRIEQMISIAHTLVEQSPWIQADLGDTYCIVAVKIWNRSINQQMSDRLRNVRVTVGETDELFDNPPSYLICGYIPGTPAGVVFTVDCNRKMFGRFVRITAVDVNDSLNIYEMAILGWW